MPLNPKKKTSLKEEAQVQLWEHNTSIAVSLAAISVALGLTGETILVGIGLGLAYAAGRVGR